MKLLLQIIALVVPFFSMNAMVRTESEVQLQTEPEEGEEVQQIWIGPGFYYGIWFTTEGDYDGWYRSHRHHGGGHHGGGGHHHGGGGGHHGGGGGGHHHGGGGGHHGGGGGGRHHGGGGGHHSGGGGGHHQGH
jgi:hypothetical protein